MTHYLPREFVNERLRLTVPTSYRILGDARHYGARISSDWVVELLNRARRGYAAGDALRGIPSDLLTGEELASEMAESHITAHDLLNWSSRKKNIVPHFRLTSHTRLYRREDVERWLETRCVSRRTA